MRLFFFLLLVFIWASDTLTAERIVSSVVRINDVAYYMHQISHSSDAKFSALDRHLTAEPCTLLNWQGRILDAHRLNQTLQGFADTDDVWSRDFINCAILQTTDHLLSLSQESENVLRSLGAKYIFQVRLAHQSERLPEGPYFLDYGTLYEAYRLYPDTSQAFIIATIPAAERNTYRSLDVSAYGEQFPSALTVAVPSRLYFNQTEEKPYAGLRIALKDVMDLKGIKTGASSRAYTELYPPRQSNAEVVQHLIDLGFVIIGKLKTTQFGDSEWPTCDWVDYPGPFNPQGDGYLTPSSGSPGSGSAVASYAWLDFSLGTDRVKAPAAVHSLFGMRPTLGATSTQGLLTYSPHWDTVGGIARTASEFKTLAQALYGPPDTSNMVYEKPTKLLYPTDYLPSDDPASQEVFEAFVSHVEDYLGVSRTEISLADLWRENHPQDLSGSLTEAFHYTFDWTSNSEQWARTLKPFIQDYIEKMGKHPYLNPQLRFKEGYSPTVTEEQYTEGLRLLQIYHDWFFKHVMPPAENGHSSTVMILPWTAGDVLYRDAYKVGPQEFTGRGFFYYNVAPYAQCPEVVFPVGTTPYVSHYTHRIEQLPAAMGLVAAKGSDLMLVDLVEKIFQDWDSGTSSRGSNESPLITDEL
ncbi:hypothetical protein ACJ41O_000972 [Fusarium nematophilum]